MSITDKLNSFRDNSNAWLNLFLKIVLIFAGFTFITWMGISIYANTQEFSFIEIKNDVSVEKAQYEFVITTTGEVLLTQDFDCSASGDRSLYVLHGYYKIVKDKWKYNKADLSLDENYFGEIDYQVRY